MPQIGTPEKPVKLKWNKVVKVSSSAYTGTAKQNYDNNYDKIFNKTKKTTEAN